MKLLRRKLFGLNIFWRLLSVAHKTLPTRQGKYFESIPRINTHYHQRTTVCFPLTLRVIHPFSSRFLPIFHHFPHFTAFLIFNGVGIQFNCHRFRSWLLSISSRRLGQVTYKLGPAQTGNGFWFGFGLVGSGQVFGKSFGNFNQRKLKRKRRASISTSIPSHNRWIVRMMKAKAQSQLAGLPLLLYSVLYNIVQSHTQILYGRIYSDCYCLPNLSLASYLFYGQNCEWKPNSPNRIAVEDNELFVYSFVEENEKRKNLI